MKPLIPVLLASLTWAGTAQAWQIVNPAAPASSWVYITTTTLETFGSVNGTAIVRFADDPAAVCARIGAQLTRGDNANVTPARYMHVPSMAIGPALGFFTYLKMSRQRVIVTLANLNRDCVATTITLCNDDAECTLPPPPDPPPPP